MFQSNIGGFLNGVDSVVDKLTSVAKGILCLPSLIGRFLNFQTNIGGFASAIASAVAGIVSNIIDSQLALIGNLINQFVANQLAIVNQILDTIDGIISFFRGLFDKVANSLAYLKSQENCTYAASELLSCIIKAGVNVRASNPGITSRLDEFNTKLVDKVMGSRGAAGVVQDYLDRNTAFLNKATAQMQFQSSFLR